MKLIETKSIDINKIKIKENSRLGDDSYNELMESINQHGLLEPIGVSLLKNNEYMLLWGSRRLNACRKLLWINIPAKIYDEISDKDFLIVNTIENIQRKDLTPYEIGRIVVELLKQGYNKKEVASLLSIPKSRIHDVIQIYETAPEEYRYAVTFGHSGKKTIGIPSTTAGTVSSLMSRISMSPENKKEIFKIIHDEQMSEPVARKFTQLVNRTKNITEGLASLNKTRRITISPFLLIEEINILERKYNKKINQILKLKIESKINDKITIIGKIMSGNEN